MKLDHIVIGTDDLECGVAELEEALGIAPAVGGEHPSWGTHNALLSLGRDRYLELIAPLPESVLRPSLWPLADLQFRGLVPVAWALATESVDLVAAGLRRLGFGVGDPIPGSRTRPDGSTLSWRLLPIMDERLPTAPFFIEWGVDVVHPGESSPSGCTLKSLALRDPEPVLLRQFFEAIQYEVMVEQADRRHIAVELETPKGNVELTWNGMGDTPVIRFA